MDYLPLFYDIKRQPCLIVGGGDVALRKAESLARSGAILSVVAPEIVGELQSLVKKTGGQCHGRAFEEKDIDGFALVVAATDDEAVNQQVHDAAQKTGCLLNVVDNPSLSNFIMPAVIDRNPLVIAISSAGKAPVLARIVRSRIETLFSSNYGVLAELAGSYRDKVKQTIKTAAARLRFWENVFHGVAAERALSGDMNSARKIIEEALNTDHPDTLPGEVFLVGAGPGDPDLLTFRALRLMQQCDVVLYDRLVSDGVMALVRKDAKLIYVGKKRAEHAVPQENINQMLVTLAQQGKRVLRLKGGDPFIFGRGGEEIDQLAENNIPFQVVPGVTAASGCAAYAGIPLTHRDHAQSVRFITGHLKDGSINLEFSELADPHQTLVIYMGLMGLQEICQGLVKSGRDKNTPAAMVEKGTTHQQRVIIGTINDLPERVARADLHAPTLLIIGGVVSLHQKLQWFNPVR